MEVAMNMANKLINSNTFINIFLVGSFTALGARSMYQQNLIEALESEKQALTNTNKSMKKSMWDWKQQLYAEASSPDTAIVPLSRLKAIYGEVISVPSVDGTSSFARTECPSHGYGLSNNPSYFKILVGFAVTVLGENQHGYAALKTYHRIEANRTLRTPSSSDFVCVEKSFAA
ncbi:hypothetical protein RDABS01_008902 [Bienertia sinuspersici]